ncbi:MAG: aminotransferase class III-fold pyridoxal phosphate-dependent enzyme [Gemmatimonadota bacterium]|nr:MAG: aminotransferase class III-fold pyridoxal phosphate-dependent enzyme [Gemmatimonadota bacterium]
MVQRPSFSSSEASDLLTRHFGIEGRLAPLPSYGDQNFEVRLGQGEFVILKISGTMETEAELDLQNSVLIWLAEHEPDLPAPRIVPSTLGDNVVSVTDGGGRTHFARALSYLHGQTLANVRPHAGELLEGLGRYLGTLDRALSGFSHPAATRTGFDWDLARAGEVMRRDVGAVSDQYRRSLVQEVLSYFEQDALPLLPSLRRGVIHNDANDHNVIVSPVGVGTRAIAGLIDFGDVLDSHPVCELAIAIAYAMLDKPDPVGAAAEVTRGYHQALPLTEDELEALYALARARLGVSVSISARRRAEAEEDAYLAISEPSAWQTLERLADVPPRLARARLREAAGLPPCPRSAAVRKWLAAHSSECGPVVRPPVTDDATVIFDLSVGSLDLENPEALADTERWSARLLGQMDEAGARVGVGRYDEARLCYTGDAFASSGGERPEQRTVHLGVDLFLEEGSAILAPLAGRVHSFHDNADPFDYGPTIILEHEQGGGPPFYTLYGHLSRDSLEGLVQGAEIRRGERIARLGDIDVNGGWPLHLHLQIITDLLDMEGTFPGVAAPSQRAVWLSLSPDPGLLIDLPEGSRAPREPEPDTLREARGRLLGPSLSLSYEKPLYIVRGWKQHLFDAEGQTYLDCVNNVCHVGHSHPHVVDAIRKQAAVLNTNTRYLHQNLTRYAERLAATLPDPLEVCFFVNSGSEANELALRMASTFTRRADVVVVDGAYHGNTAACIAISPYKFDGVGGSGPPEHVHTAVMPDDYRGPYRREDPHRSGRYARHVADALAAAQARAGGAAAFICESLLGCGGQIELPPAYLEGAFRHARDAGAVCIADEVQVGFGRVGSHFWGFETQGVVPDIVTMGKPIGNAHPMGAVVTTRDIAEAFEDGMEYFNTFGGNPVSCAAGLAVLDVIENEGLQQHAMRVGEYMKTGLTGLQTRRPLIGDVRGRGLFMGIEFVRAPDTREPAADVASYVVERMRDHGILLSTNGPAHNVIKIKPPLPFSETDADRVIETLDKVLGEDPIHAEPPGG